MSTLRFRDFRGVYATTGSVISVGNYATTGSSFLYLYPVNREFLLNIVLLVFINLLIKPFFIFGIDLAVQNKVGSEYGIYFALLNFSYLFQIFSDFGIQNYNNRHVSQHPHLLGKYFPNLLVLKLFLSLGYFILAMLVAFLLAGYGRQELPLLAVLLFNQVLVQLILFLRTNISGLGFYRIDSLLSTLDKLLMLVFCSILLWGGVAPLPLTVLQFALAQTLALLCTVALVYLILRHKAEFTLRPSWLRNPIAGKPTLVLLFKKSFPFALVVLLMTAYTRLDGVLLERLLPDGRVHADVYAGAYRLLDAGNMFGYLFASLLLPMFARMLARKEPVRELVSMSFKLIWLGSLSLAALVYFGRVELVQLMMPERAMAYRWDTLGVLIWTFVPVCTIYIFSTLLTADEKLMQMNRFFVVGILLDLGLNLVLIPRFQALGSAWATLLTQTFVALAMLGLCVRFYGFRPSARGLLQVSGVAIWILGTYWFIFTHVSAGFVQHALWAIVSSAVALLLGALLYKGSLREAMK